MKKLFSTNIQSRAKGYLLPATLLLGLGISIMSGTFLQYTATTSETLNTQAFQNIADEAAQAGIAFADSCLSQGSSWSAANPLRPNTTCTGTISTGSAYVNQQGTEWRSRFSVPPTDAQSNVVSTGTVEILSGSTVVKTYTSTSKMSVGSNFTTSSIASGNVITEVKAQNTDCAIANGKLYCWGRNNNGEIGDNTTTDRSNPTLVGGALAGKTVTDVNVSDVSVCAIADGAPYCWGNNNQGQLGSGNKTDRRIPTANVPTYSSGVLSGGFVTEIATSPFNMPAIIWPLSIAVQHTCALKANGSVACWGSNGFRQLTKKACFGVMLAGVCIGVSAYPDNDTPDLIDGYSDNSGPFAGKKADRVGASSHDSCLVAQGRMYCMGVEVPLNITCNSPLFYPANVVSIDLNPCTLLYSPGYDMSGKGGFFGGFTIDNKYIDSSTWEVGANVGCGMANKSFFCVGNGSTVGVQWSASWAPPWEEMSNADITSHDNGENEVSAGLDGIYCAVDKGIAKCNTSLFAGLLYSGGSGIGSWGALNTTRGLSVRTPTDIAAGTTHGCLAANGQLYCWGVGSNGRLANGSSASITYPTMTGTGGSTPIGTTPVGTTSTVPALAADGPIASGGSHSCGTANGHLFCWGTNTNGQLGTGDTTSQSQPLQLQSISTKYVTKVSAGTNHTCAIIDGQVYCWGLNTSGQLGLNDTTQRLIPTLVNGNGALTTSMRVTDVSAGVNNTCVIANGLPYCWGNNSHKKLGDNTTTQRNTPVRANAGAFSTSISTTKISTGTDHTCAIANGDAYCWGWDQNGRTGIGVETNTDSNPTLITGGTAGSPTGPNSTRPLVTDIAAGGDFSCGIFNGTVSCWGASASGQLGIGTESWIEYGTPYKAACNYALYPLNPNNCDGRDSCGFLCWAGYKWVTPTTNHTNELRDKSIPTAINGSAGTYYATQLGAGTAHACALIHGNSSATNGNIWCWGAGANGRLGNGGTANSNIPVLINGGDTNPAAGRRVATSISVGPATTCSVANGVILCWGAGTSNQIGNLTATDRTTPTTTAGYRFIAPYAKGLIF